MQEPWLCLSGAGCPRSPDPTGCWGCYLWGHSPNTGCSWGYFTSQGPVPQSLPCVWGALGVISCPKVPFLYRGCLGCPWGNFTSQDPVPTHGVFGVLMGLFHVPRSCSYTQGVWGACGVISHPKVPFPYTGCLGCPWGYFMSQCPCGGQEAGCPPGEALGAAFPPLFCKEGLGPLLGCQLLAACCCCCKSVLRSELQIDIKLITGGQAALMTQLIT